MAKSRAAQREAVSIPRGNVRGELRVLDDRAALADEAAREITFRARAAVLTRGRFEWALAGGSTPRDLYRRLVESPYREEFPWQQTRVFWGDERAVPPDHVDSNYRMAREALLDHVPIPPVRIHRMRAELQDLASAANAYERTLSAAFGLATGEVPRLDVALLGLGADGHTASLFPQTGAVTVRDHLAIAVHVPPLGVDRVSLTVPVFEAARTVIFLVAGEDKAEALARAIVDEPEGGDDWEACPARAIRPRAGELLWLVDRAAASRVVA